MKCPLCDVFVVGGDGVTTCFNTKTTYPWRVLAEHLQEKHGWHHCPCEDGSKGVLREHLALLMIESPDDWHRHLLVFGLGVSAPPVTMFPGGCSMKELLSTAVLGAAALAIQNVIQGGVLGIKR